MNKKALVVEDDSNIAELLRLYLGKDGFEVAIALDGGKAVSMKMMSSYSSIEGIGFAIPSASAAEAADQLISGGEITGRPSIGITVGPVTEAVAEHYSIPNGLYVSSVSKGSNAEAQGVKAGDILTAVNGKTVTETSQVSDIKNALQVGDSLTLTLWRDGKTFSADVKLVEANQIY